MVKSVEEICNNLAKNYSLFNIQSEYYSMPKTQRTLVSCCRSKYLKNNHYNEFFENDNLYDSLVNEIVINLASAIDENNVSKIKYLKNKYGNLSEFKKAKEFLNEKCKEVWNVYEYLKNVPKAAMKSLGISNQPDLNFIFENSIKYYEKDNSNITSYIIEKTLKNPNLSYDMSDIHNYLKEMNNKYSCEYNFKTVKYLIKEQKYTKNKLKDLNIKQETICAALKELDLKHKIRFYLNMN